MADFNRIRAIIFQEAGQWVAQCIEVDIGAQGSNIDEVVSRLTAAINEEATYTEKTFGRPFANIDPAPQHFEDMWDRCSKTFEARPVVRTPVNTKVEARLCA